jgi:hypothetical protein
MAPSPSVSALPMKFEARSDACCWNWRSEACVSALSLVKNEPSSSWLTEPSPFVSIDLKSWSALLLSALFAEPEDLSEPVASNSSTESEPSPLASALLNSICWSCCR